MFCYSLKLPNLSNLNETVMTLIKGQIFIENFNISKPINMCAVTNFDRIIQFIFDPTRMLRIYGRSCHNLLPGEVKIVNLSDSLKKQVLQLFVDSQIVPANSSIREAYMCINNFATDEIKNSIFGQHFVLNMQIIVYESSKLPENSQGVLTYSQDENQDEDIMVIKIEDDSN